MTTTVRRRVLSKRPPAATAVKKAPAPEASDWDAEVDLTGIAFPQATMVRDRPAAMVRRRRPAVELSSYELYPLDAPGMPVPGQDFIRMAQEMGDDGTEIHKPKSKKDRRLTRVGDALKQLYRNALYSSGDFQVRTTIKGNQCRELPVVSGHLWGLPEDELATGPICQADVMVIGKMLGEQERNACRTWIGPSGQLLLDTCRKFGIRGITKWYMTNVIKTEHPLAEIGKTDIKAPWIDEWLPLLHQELRLVRPKFILCVGADASKALLGKQASVSWMEGRVVEFEYSLNHSANEEGPILKHRCLVMTCTHPAAVLAAAELTDKFENGIARFGQLVSGIRWDQEEEGLDHRTIDSLEELKNLYYEIKADCEDNLLAVDAEWHGEHPQNEGAYMRTIQLSWRHKTAVCIRLREPGGKWCFRDGGMKAVAYWINKICRGRRIAGHFLVADMEWLGYHGINLQDQFTVAETWEETMVNARKKKRGGFDTGYAAHAVSETDDLGLTYQALRHTSAPRYDVKLTAWKEKWCNENKKKAKDLEGYGECPSEILEPYGIYDADVTRRLVIVYQRLLSKDRFGNNCWEGFWTTMRVIPGLYEMNTTGVLVDRKRLDEMTETYMFARVRLEQTIRDWARWEDFNLNSTFQVREFLFGEDKNGKDRHPDYPEIPIRLRPKGAKSLRLTPILTTDKRPMYWDEVCRRGLEDQKTPGTNKMCLAILARDAMKVPKWLEDGTPVHYDLSKQVNWIRDYRFISQVLKSVLRPPCIIEDPEDKDAKKYVKDRDGFMVYTAGLAAAVCDDGRVRTHFYPTKETGRWSSARPPLQNLGKRREKDYKRILGANYKYALRSVIMASPGHVLVEADYIGAELFGMAIMAGDKQMIQHAIRNQLAEWHKDFYDIHSNVAVLAFGYNCEPTKAGLESIGMAHMRIVAKAVIFGIAYGRQAKAIALAAREEGVNITVEQAQRVIDTIFEIYPKLRPFFDNCAQRSLNERWLCGPFGRFRRFHVSRDFKSEGDMQRQAMNFPIQGMIADAMDRAIDFLYHYRGKYPELVYKLVLQIHDAVILEVPYDQVGIVIDDVLPTCMCKNVPIYPVHLDGTPTGAGPYTLGIDTAIFTHWGDQMTPEDCLERGIDPKYAGWLAHEQGWTHPHKMGKVWVDGAWADLAA